MSKNDTSKATAIPTSSILANKATQQQKRQSFLKRLAQSSNTTSTAISPTKSTPFLSTSYPPPSPPLPNSQPINSKQQQQQQQISRLRSVRLTLIASVSRHRPRCSSNVGASTVNTTANNTGKTIKSNNNNKKTNNATSTKPFPNINNVNIKKRQKKEEREHSVATRNMPPTKKKDRVDSSINATTSTTHHKGEQSFKFGHATSQNLLVRTENKKVQIRKQQQQQQQQTERCIEAPKSWPHKDKLHHTQKPRPFSQQSPQPTQSDDDVSLQICQQRQRPLSQQPHLYQHDQYSSLDVKEGEIESKEKNEEDDEVIPTVVSSAVSSSITASSEITEELLPPWRRSLPLSATTTTLHFRQSSISSSSSSSSSVQTLTSNNNSTQIQHQEQDHHPVIKSKFLSKLNGDSSFVMALEENTTSLPPPPKQQRKRSSHNNTAASMLCDNNNKQSPAPVVSSSSIYPFLEPPNRRTTLPMVLLKSSLSIDRSTKIMKPTRAQTMFAVISSGVHKKETKAISIWRETVNNLLLVSDNSANETTTSPANAYK
ncbi:hypothetical protein BDC45DRAFT_293808 [Circinella umbellata]|nr:hypothetical protein BDC45DRAFT_293808 [Circinella umbellata]